MDNYRYIHEKLRDFIRKFYVNEIIRGGIFFLTLGLIYFLITLTIEHTLWLGVVGRTILFWLFILTEFVLLARFVLLPLLRLTGLKKGIGQAEASVIIGKHFKEVDDKLLNIIQLGENDVRTDLLVASIEQKASKLKPIPFKRAIEIKGNLKYLKYILIPIVIGGSIWLTGNKSFFTQSLNRVVHHNTVFLPPAPFQFKILNESLTAIEEKSFRLRFVTIGEVEPETVSISFAGERYYLNRDESGEWDYTFQFPTDDVEFVLQGNEINSMPHTLSIIKTPKITDFSMKVVYPDYIGKNEDVVKNTGNAEVPEGTTIFWEVSSTNANELSFAVLDPRKRESSNKKRMTDSGQGIFTYEKRVRNKFKYQVASSNENLNDFESLRYEISVIKDEYPKIFVRTDLDSMSRGPSNFVGQLTDDYGLSRLQVIAKNISSGKQSIGKIDIGRSDLEEFYYTFPGGLILDEGESYELYFEVYDNDGINGAKRSVSESFYFRNMSQEEIDREILKEQQQGIESLEGSDQERKKLENELEEFSKKLKTKESADWNDQKELDEFLERQKKYKKMMEKNSDRMLENLKQMDEEENEELNSKKEELEKRWEEMNDLKSKEDLLKELEELADKLEKEELIERIDKLKEQSKQEKRSLERILELTKQFYVEKKSVRIMEKLEQLAEEQLELSNEEEINSQEQDELNKKFDSIQQEFDELREQNESLKEPMPLHDSKADEKLIEMEMDKAKKDLEKSESKESSEENMKEDGEKKNASSSAKKNQKSASKRMKELSGKMKSGMMAMEMQGVQENIEDLQQILKNLVLFSEDQEKLMMDLENITDRNAEFPAKLKEQVKLKEHFEHIDDSLYTLSMRVVTLSSEIEKDLTEAHYNLNKSLENLSENRIKQGRSNQQYTMVAANNLADMLSNMLESLQNQQPGSGQGSGKEEELSLPDIIKKQQGLSKKMQQEMKGKGSEGQKEQEELSGQQFRMYQEQQMIKEELKKILDEQGEKSGNGKKALDAMEELERILLEKGVTQESIDRMQKLEYELLELENASIKQNKDAKREATTNRKEYDNGRQEDIQWGDFKGQEKETLRRENIKLSPDYQKRVKFYFEKRIDSI